MTNDNITEEQISTFNHAFHTLWFEIMTSRPEFRARDFKGLTFTDIYVISISQALVIWPGMSSGPAFPRNV